MNRSKKILALLLALALTACWAAVAFAAPTADNIEFSYDEDTKTLTVTGTGAIPDDYHPWMDLYWDKAEALVVGEGITEIGENAFAKMLFFRTVKLPSTLTSIGKSSFYNCEKLDNITIPASVTRIDDYAFQYCEDLITVYYGGTAEDWSLINMGADVFDHVRPEMVVIYSEAPATPDTPGETTGESAGACPWCSRIHGDSLLDQLIALIHGILNKLSHYCD